MDRDPDAPDIDLETADEERSPFLLVAQFFIIPLGVVALAVAIFLLFGLFTREKHAPAEYLAEVVAGSKTRRWQAAYELATTLGNHPELIQDEPLFQATLRTFAATEETEVRRYLALALGRFARKEAVPALSTALSCDDEETRLYAALALSSIRDPAAVGPLIELLRAEEPALRKAAAYALGQIADPRAGVPLRTASEDRAFDVSLQAAVALAQIGDAHGLPVLRSALLRSFYADAVARDPIRAMEPEQESDAIITAIRGIVLLKDADSAATLHEIAATDTSLRVRGAARAALVELGT